MAQFQEKHFTISYSEISTYLRDIFEIRASFDQPSSLNFCKFSIQWDS